MIDFKLETQPDEGGDDSKTLGNMSGATPPDGTRDGAGLEEAYNVRMEAGTNARMEASAAAKAWTAIGQSTADPESELQHRFKTFMAATILLTIGIYTGAYWIGHALWADEMPEDQGVTGTSTDGLLPWTPFNALSEENLTLVASAFLWLTVCITGLGSEMVVGEWFVQKLSEGDGTVLWHASQLLFSLCISISLYSATPLGLPFTVVGLWKFGFPETIGAYRRAWLGGASRVDGLKEFMNGMGVTLHHTSSAWLIVGITTGLFVPRTRAIMAVSLPLVGQHLGVLVKYHNLGLYVLINLVLEIWWEWELFQQQQQLTRARGYHVSIHGCSLTMLFAHWLYWSAALLEIPKLVGGAESKTTQKVEEFNIANNQGKTERVEEAKRRRRRSTFSHLRSTANAYSSESARDGPVACRAVSV